jgi:hypothetical protein
LGFLRKPTVGRKKARLLGNHIFLARCSIKPKKALFLNDMDPCRITHMCGSGVREGCDVYNMRNSERERGFLPNGSKVKGNLCNSR